MNTPAFADVWGYIDEKGVAHFASQRLDERYEIFFQAVDTGIGVRGDAFASPLYPVPPRPVAVPTAPPKLLAFFEVSPRFKLVKHHLREASKTHNIDYELLQALIATESGFDPSAVSPKGAVGLMQLMPATARRYGVRDDRINPVERKLTDPRLNVATGSRYLRDLINLFPGKLDLALAAYNAGEGAVQRAGNKVPNYKETQNYVATVMQLYNVLKPPASLNEQRHGERARARQIGGAVNRGNMVSLAGLPGDAQMLKIAID